MNELAGHITNLVGGGPTGTPSQAEKTGGTFDGEDSLLEGPLQVEEASIPEFDDGGVDDGLDRTTKKVEEGPTDSIESLRRDLEAAKTESAGRLDALTGFRARQRETSENMEEMRKMFVSLSDKQEETDQDNQRQIDLEDEAAMYGEDVVNDPSARYIRDLLTANREQFEQYQQQQEHHRQTLNDQREQYTEAQTYNKQMLDMLRTQEETFSKENPDYGDAYKDLRGKRLAMWSRRGYAPAQAENLVKSEEEQLMTEQLPRGGNVAREIYQLAKDWGWTPKNNDTSQSLANERVDAQADIDRIRAGIGSRGAGQMLSAGTAGGSTGKEMTREQFFATVPASKRTELFMERPDVFEQLGRHGRVIRDWD